MNIRDRHCLGVGLYVIYVDGSSAANAQLISVSRDYSRRRSRYKVYISLLLLVCKKNERRIE